MKRYAVCITIWILLVFVHAEPFGVREKIKAVLEGQFSQALGRAVHIDRLEGNLYQRIVLKNVVVGNGPNITQGVFAAADTIEVKYSLKNAVLDNFDVLAHVSKITVIRPKVTVARDALGAWNFLPTQSVQEKKDSRQANLLVQIVNGTVVFNDRRGFGATPTAFTTELTSLNAGLTLKNEHMAITFAGMAAGKQRFMALQGDSSYDLLTSRGRLAITGKNCELGFIAQYLQLPLSLQGLGDIKIASVLAGKNTSLDYSVAVNGVRLSYQGVVGTGVVGSLTKTGQDLKISIAEANIASGNIHGVIALRSGKKLRLLPETAMVLNHIMLENLFPKIGVTGSVTGKLACEGTTDTVLVTLAFPHLDIVTQNQHLTSLAVQGVITPESTMVTAAVCLNGETTQVQGRFAKDWDFFSVGQPLRVVFPQQGLLGETDLLSSVSASLRYSPHAKTFSAEAVVSGGGQLAGDAVDSYRAVFRYQDGVSTISEIEIKLPHSRIAGQARIANAMLVTVSESSIDVRDSHLLQRMLPGSIGRVALQGVMQLSPTLSLDVHCSADQLRYDELFIRSLQADLLVASKNYTIPRYTVDLDGNVFYGAAAIASESPDKLFSWRDGVAQFSLTTTHTDLATLQRLVFKIQEQARVLSTRFDTLGSANVAIVPVTVNTQLPLYSDYSADGVQQYRQLVSLVTNNVPVQSNKIAGVLSGTVHLENNHGTLNVAADLQVSSGTTPYAQWDTLQCVINTIGPTINLNAAAQGLVVSPNISLAEASLKAKYAAGVLSVEEGIIRAPDALPSSVLSGSFPIAAFWDKSLWDSPFQYRVTIHGDEINLLTPYLKSVAYIHNDGILDIVCSGSYRDYVFSAEAVQLKNFTLGLRNPYYQQLNIKKASLKLTENQLELGSCDIELHGETKPIPLFKLSGLIGVDHFSFLPKEKIAINTRLLLKDIDNEEIHIKNIYVGNYSLRNASLVGTFSIPLSSKEKEKQKLQIDSNAEEGPILTGQLDVSNGTLYLMKIDKDISVKSDKFVSLLLDFDINVKNDVRVQTRDSVLSGDINMLSQLNVGIRENNPTVKVGGSLNYFKIAGMLYFDDGYVSLLNRTFSLIDKNEQAPYVKQSERHAADNYLEFKETARFTLDPRFSFTAQTVVVDTVLASTNQVLTTPDAVVQEPQYVTTEKEYVVFIDGSIFDLSAFSFQRYVKQGVSLVSDGDPYVLKDATGKMLDTYRFRELAYDLAPSAVKTAWRNSTGVAGGGTWDMATKETLREMSATEVNFLMRSVMRPLERKLAQSVSLYDIKIKRDFGNKDVVSRLTFLQDSQTALQSETPLGVSQELGVQFVKDIWRERLFLTIDTSLDRNLQTNVTQYLVSSWKVTYRFLKDFSLLFVVLDEVDLNAGNEKDQVTDTYIPVLSLDALHSF